MAKSNNEHSPAKGYDKTVEKGRNAEREGFQKGHRSNGNLNEGYQPTSNPPSKPPTGGSGVPDKK